MTHSLCFLPCSCAFFIPAPCSQVILPEWREEIYEDEEESDQEKKVFVRSKKSKPESEPNPEPEKPEPKPMRDFRHKSHPIYSNFFGENSNNVSPNNDENSPEIFEQDEEPRQLKLTDLFTPNNKGKTLKSNRVEKRDPVRMAEMEKDANLPSTKKSAPRKRVRNEPPEQPETPSLSDTNERPKKKAKVDEESSNEKEESEKDEGFSKEEEEAPKKLKARVPARRNPALKFQNPKSKSSRYQPIDLEDGQKPPEGYMINLKGQCLPICGKCKDRPVIVGRSSCYSCARPMIKCADCNRDTNNHGDGLCNTCARKKREKEKEKERKE